MTFVCIAAWLLACGETEAPVAMNSPAAPATAEPEAAKPEAVEAAKPEAVEAAAPEAVEAAEPAVDPAIAPVEGESPDAAIERCAATQAKERCVVLALEGREPLRSGPRQALIEALEVLGEKEKALAHMRVFVRDYPRDRRGNRYRIAIDQAD